MPANKNYKDSVFTALFSQPGHFLIASFTILIRFHCYDKINYTLFYLKEVFDELYIPAPGT